LVDEIHRAVGQGGPGHGGDGIDHDGDILYPKSSRDFPLWKFAGWRDRPGSGPALEAGHAKSVEHGDDAGNFTFDESVSDPRDLRHFLFVHE
jgi:hypothetical protein